MNGKLLLIAAALIFSNIRMEAQVLDSVQVDTPGTLSALLTADQKSNVTNLIVKGNIDARDFKTLRDSMSLSEVDLRQAVIDAYSGSDGPHTTEFNYPADEIPYRAFDGDRDLVSIYFPESVRSVGVYAFRQSSNLNHVGFSDSLEEIQNFAFYFCSDLESVDLPGSLGTISNSAFYYSGLTSLHIPASVTEFGSSVAGRCLSLTDITVDPANMHYRSIDGVLFTADSSELLQYPIGRPDLEYLVPAGVEVIRESSFAYCDSLTNISLPSSLLLIMDRAFAYCDGLRQVDFPGSLTEIEDWAFSNCNSLESLVFPAGLATIYSNTFYSCPAISTIEVHDENPEYSSMDNVLYNKDKTELILFPAGFTGEFTIPGSVTSVGYRAFYGCIGLTDIHIPGSVTEIAYGAFQKCTGLSTIAFPSEITSIGGFCFDDCEFDSIILPPNLESISNAMFIRSTLKSVYIPASVTAIDGIAFQDCLELRNIHVFSSDPVVLNASSNVFNNVQLDSITLYVPSGSSANYSAAQVWSDFPKIVEVDYSIEVSNDTLFIPNEQHTSGVSVVANTYWPATTDRDYLKLTQQEYYGYGVIYYEVEENRSLDAREAVITIHPNGLEDRMVTLIQIGGDTIFEVSHANLLLDSMAAVSREVLVNSNIPWTASSDAGWIQAEKLSGTDGIDTLMLTVESNPADTERTAMISIQAEGSFKSSIQVTQMAGISASFLAEQIAEKIMVYPNPVNKGFYLGGIRGKADISITDLGGRVLLEDRVEPGEYIDTGTLGKGMYLLIVRSGGTKQEIKFVVR